MSIFCGDDDDVFVIALWIIAIGFIILAIDKTVKLNNPSNNGDSGTANGSSSQTQCPTPVDQNNQEDAQFQEIQKQLKQLGNGIHALKQKIRDP